jgi:hypothetical protein
MIAHSCQFTAGSPRIPTAGCRWRAADGRKVARAIEQLEGEADEAGVVPLGDTGEPSRISKGLWGIRDRSTCSEAVNVDADGSEQGVTPRASAIACWLQSRCFNSQARSRRPSRQSTGVRSPVVIPRLPHGPHHLQQPRRRSVGDETIDQGSSSLGSDRD